MQRHRSRGAVTTAVDEVDLPSERRIQRLRLTLRPGDVSAEHHERKTAGTNTDGKMAVDPGGRRNGYVQPSGRPGQAEGEQPVTTTANGVRDQSPQRKPWSHGVTQGTSMDRRQEVMSNEWSVNHLRDEMNYIKAVRDSLEKVRERMYGQFGGMQQSMQKLSQDIKAANAQRRDLEAQVHMRTTAMESLDQMNSSLLSANISLQKSLLENCVERVEKQDELRTLRSSCRQAEAKLRERDRELASAHAENQTLRLQIESSQEASLQALQEVSQRLQSQYEERLREEQRKHREEIEALQAQIDEYVKRLEEAETRVRTAEAKIAEKDQRISELERLLDCMGQEKSQLLQKLQDCEMRLHTLEQQTDRVDEAVLDKSQQLEDEAAELRERIKHLNDMVFCQQRKVKTMIEEVEMLRATVAEKDMFITELLDRIAVAESENGAKHVETRDIGVGCNLPLRSESQPPEELQSRPYQWSPRQSSRLEFSLLKYSPQQYSLLLQSSSAQTSSTDTSPTRSASDRVNPVQSSPTQHSSARTTPALSGPEQSAVLQSNQKTSASPTGACTPHKRLWEISEISETE